MMFKAGLLSVMLLALAGCASGRGATANEAQSQMIGMSKEQILKCMGPPHSSYVVGSSTEVWAYNSTPRNAGAAPACIVNVMMQDSQVIDIDYRGAAGVLLPNDKQCAYAVENCIK
jgi:outer membrane protein assembly factor BamE (lipoprotein component of BamABCDE complex)